MSMDLKALVDISLSFFILFFIIGKRFNEWPEAGQSMPKLSGRPSDYINPFRYYTFFFGYISTFLVIGVAAANLGLAVQDYIPINAELTNLLTILGDNSYTIYALFLLAILNIKFINDLDNTWRNRLQNWARIPKALMELKEKVQAHADEITLTDDQLNELRSEILKDGVGDYWEPIINRWKEEQEKSSLEWHFLKTKHIHLACKKMSVNMLFDKKRENKDAENQDVENCEKRLKELAYMISTPGRHNDETKHYMNEVTNMYTYLVECLCKHVIRKYPSKKIQLKALVPIGLNIKLPIIDASEPHIIAPALTCILCISIVCFLTVASYLCILTWLGFVIRENVQWFSWTRVFQWSGGSIISYGMAIFIAIAIEKSSKGINYRLPQFMTYVMALIFSTLVSLSFFRIANPDRPLKWEAFISLALSMGIISFAVIRSLSKPTPKKTKGCLVSARNHAIIIGLFAAFLQALTVLFFRGLSDITLNALIISWVYGFVKGAIVTFVVSFIIQESMRIQLVIGQRKTPRAKFKVNLPVIIGNTDFSITTRDISMGGMKIEHENRIKKGEHIELFFDFAEIGKVKGLVQWATKQFAGLAFTEENQKIEALRNFISNQFGPEYI